MSRWEIWRKRTFLCRECGSSESPWVNSSDIRRTCHPSRESGNRPLCRRCVRGAMESEVLHASFNGLAIRSMSRFNQHQ